MAELGYSPPELAAFSDRYCFGDRPKAGDDTYGTIILFAGLGANVCSVPAYWHPLHDLDAPPNLFDLTPKGAHRNPCARP